jgi:hypothetical protein
VTGVGTWHVGQVIILAAHCAVLLLVFFLIRALGLSTTAAFLGSLVYSLNSSFMYFDTEFSYEGLGIALAFMTILFIVLARRSETQRVALIWSVGAGASGLACIVTHHVSAAFMVGVIFVLAVLTPPRRRDGPSAANWAPVATAMTVLIAWVLWLGFVAPSTIGYIGPHVLGGIRDLVHIVSGSGGNSGGQRQLFSGSTAPVYERISAFLAPLIVGVLTLAAVRVLWRRRRDRRHLLLVGPLVAVSAVYFLSLPLALTASGSETAHRAWGYGYLGVAIAAAYAFSAGELTRFTRQRWVAPVAAALLLVLAVGNVAAGQNLDYRFPGPAEFGSDTRSRTPEAMELARWADRALPPGSKVVTDRFTGEVITGYTDLRTVPPTESWALQLYREGGYATPSVTRFLAQHHYRYWIVDTRILTQLPKQKFFQNYVGPESVSPLAIETAGTTPLLRLVHRMGPYEIFWINW